jgi:hypothetical protein
MSSSWLNPLPAMFSLFWPSPTSKKQHISPTNATNQQQHGSTNRTAIRDIEAAVGSCSTQPSATSTNRSYPQHDVNDPLHRRSIVTVGNNLSNSHVETSETSAVLAPSDALSSSIRSGNFTTADLLESKETTVKAIRGSSKGQMMTPEPILLHPYVLR